LKSGKPQPDNEDLAAIMMIEDNEQNNGATAPLSKKEKRLIKQ